MKYTVVKLAVSKANHVNFHHFYYELSPKMFLADRHALDETQKLTTLRKFSLLLSANF